MPQVIDTVQHVANVDVSYSVPVGKKIYALTGVMGTNIFVDMNGKVNNLHANNGSQRELLFPVPLDLAPSATLIFRGNSTSTIAIIRDE